MIHRHSLTLKFQNLVNFKIQFLFHVITERITGLHASKDIILPDRCFLCLIRSPLIVLKLNFIYEKLKNAVGYIHNHFFGKPFANEHYFAVVR